MCDSNPCDQICKKQIAYEKAIDAYQFHVQRYHTWVNYYAIFVGALFVAFYTIIAQTDFEIHYYFMEASKIRSELLLPIIIVLLGWSTSIAWFASIVGHCAWMNSWIEIVKSNEEALFSNSFFVYRKVKLSNEQDAKAKKEYGENWKNDWETNNNKFLPQFISTQKVTQYFVQIVIRAWIFAITFLGTILGLGWFSLIIFFILLALSYLVERFILNNVHKCLSSFISKIAE
mgnify:FL=1